MIDKLVDKSRLVKVTPDYFEILGTDRVEDANQLFGKAFADYREAWVKNPRENIVSDFPLHLDVEVTNTCNLRCTMCQIPFGKMKSGSMDMALYKKILSEIKQHSLPSIKFNFRGEPLMHPQIAEYVRMAKEAGVLEVQFNTNGALLNDALSKALIEAGLDRIKFSIDGVTPEVYNSIRKGTTYDKTIPRVLEFIEIRNKLGKKLPSVQVQMVYMESNNNEAQKYIEFWQDKANRIGFSRYRSSQNRLGEKESVQKLGKRFPCHQLWQRMVVLWDGKVLMCCGDHHMKCPIGDIHESSLVDIWHSKKLNAIRQLHLEHKYDDVPACVGCEVNYL